MNLNVTHLEVGVPTASPSNVAWLPCDRVGEVDFVSVFNAGQLLTLAGACIDVARLASGFGFFDGYVLAGYRVRVNIKTDHSLRNFQKQKKVSEKIMKILQGLEQVE